MEESLENCQCHLCGGKNGSSDNEFPELVPVTRLTNYLAYQNVFEAILQSPDNTNENSNTEPKLYFKLVPISLQIPEQNYILLCSNCSAELTKMDDLSSQLESTQKLVESQVQKINEIRQRSEQTLELPLLQVPICGFASGNENVLGGWQALGHILERVLTSPVSTNSESSRVSINTENENDCSNESVEFSVNLSKNTQNAAIDQPSVLTDISVEQTDTTGELAHSDESEVISTETLTNSLNVETEPTVKPAGPSRRKTGSFKTTKITRKNVQKRKPPIASCHLCSKTYKWKSNLQRHILKKHSDPSVLPHECPRCPRRFSTTSSLKVHIMLHTGERPFSCKMCGATFREARCLRNHKQVHNRVEPSRCPSCGRGYTTRVAMLYHILDKH